MEIDELKIEKKKNSLDLASSKKLEEKLESTVKHMKEQKETISKLTKENAKLKKDVNAGSSQNQDEIAQLKADLIASTKGEKKLQNQLQTLQKAHETLLLKDKKSTELSKKTDDQPFGLFSDILILQSEKVVKNNVVKSFLLKSNRIPNKRLLFDFTYLENEGMLHYRPQQSPGSIYKLATAPDFIKSEIFFKIEDQALFLAKTINEIFNDV